MSVKDLKSVYAMNNSDEVTFIDEIDLMFYIDIAFGGVKDYNGKGIIELFQGKTLSYARFVLKSYYVNTFAV